MAKNLEGKNCPKFKADATSDQIVSNETYKNKNVVIYFYPKDSTPGCTTEGQEFRDSYKKFKKLNTEIIGVSKDSIESHLKFKSKFKFPFELLSDENIKLIKELGAWGEKSMYGKKFMGIKRTTVLIGKNQKVIKIWNNVKVKDHVKTVLDFIKTFN